MKRKPNRFLEKQEILRTAYADVARTWAHQIDFDALALVLGDPEVMDKDTFGEKRMEKIYAKLNEVIPYLERGLSKEEDASYVRAQADRELKKRRPTTFVPWVERFPGCNDDRI
jgi:hypothetical protein